jgi:hypothetical protein
VQAVPEGRGAQTGALPPQSLLAIASVQACPFSDYGGREQARRSVDAAGRRAALRGRGLNAAASVEVRPRRLAEGFLVDAVKLRVAAKAGFQGGGEQVAIAALDRG